MILNHLDLNLLKVFDTVMTTRNVSQAAARLSLTQSAVSNALARLREALDDPLFLRTPQGMVPTARAEVLAGPISDTLTRLRQVLEPPCRFDPATAEGEVVIGTSDQAEIRLAPRLIARLSTAAPGLSLIFHHCDRHDVVNLLDSGVIRLALGTLPEVPPRLNRQHLTREPLRVVMAGDHPLACRDQTAAEPVRLDDYLAYGHLLISPVASRVGAIDRKLAGLGQSRRLTAVVSHALVAAPLLSSSRLLLTTPQSLADVLTQGYGLVQRPAPFDDLQASMSCLWHHKDDHDPLHRWLRQLLIAVTEG